MLDHADYTAPTLQHELDHTDHTDQESIDPEISRSPSGNRFFVRRTKPFQFPPKELPSLT